MKNFRIFSLLLSTCIVSFTAAAHVDPPKGENFITWKITPQADPAGAYVRPLDKDGKDLGLVGWVTPEMGAVLLQKTQIDTPEKLLELSKFKTRLKLAQLRSLLILVPKESHSVELNVKIQKEYLDHLAQERKAKSSACRYVPLGDITSGKDKRLTATGRPEVILVRRPYEENLKREFENKTCQDEFDRYFRNGGVPKVCVGKIACGDAPAEYCFCDAVTLDQSAGWADHEDFRTGIGSCPSADACIAQCRQHISRSGVPISTEQASGGPLKYGGENWSICAYSPENKKGFEYYPLCFEPASTCPSRTDCANQMCGSMDDGFAHFMAGEYGPDIPKP